MKANIAGSLLQKYLSSLRMSTRKVIIIIFIISLIFLITSFVYPLVGLKKINLSKIATEKAKEEKIESKQEVKPYEFYAEKIKNRQIFSKISAAEGVERPVASGAGQDAMKDISLVGIIAGENPQAIIEDKKTQKSYYVTKGQAIGELQVEEIQENKVILKYMGQNFELYM